MNCWKMHIPTCLREGKTALHYLLGVTGLDVWFAAGYDGGRRTAHSVDGWLAAFVEVDRVPSQSRASVRPGTYLVLYAKDVTCSGVARYYVRAIWRQVRHRKCGSVAYRCLLKDDQRVPRQLRPFASQLMIVLNRTYKHRERIDKAPINSW